MQSRRQDYETLNNHLSIRVRDGIRASSISINVLRRNAYIMNSNYEVILKRHTDKGDPVITPVIVSEKVWNELIKIIYRQHGDQEATGDDRKRKILQKRLFVISRNYVKTVKNIDREMRLVKGL